MQIIFNREIAEKSKEKYTVLELETIPADGKLLEAFCVIPMESLVMEMNILEHNIALHEKFVQAIKDNDVEFCIDNATTLIGQFGGELDSFYKIIHDRCTTTGSTAFTTPPPTEDAPVL